MLEIASRPGTCRVCGSEIVSGELVRHDDHDDTWAHARCVDSRHRGRRLRRRPHVTAPQSGPAGEGTGAGPRR